MGLVARVGYPIDASAYLFLSSDPKMAKVEHSMTFQIKDDGNRNRALQ
jgi:hypothetical protein